MKKTILIYKSQTGFTRRYAEWIARETGCDLMNFRQIKPAVLKGYDLVVFGSRLHAGTLDGLKKMLKIHRASGAGQLVLFATGAAPITAQDTIQQIWKQNLSAEQLNSIPHFYMQAGLNYDGMGFVDRTMMKLLSAMLRSKKQRTEADEALARMIEKSFDASDPKYILPLVEYLKNA